MRGTYRVSERVRDHASRHIARFAARTRRACCERTSACVSERVSCFVTWLALFDRVECRQPRAFSSTAHNTSQPEVC
jgi:hypothetical protein